MSALDKQVGGNHYKQYAIQPYEFFIRNKIEHKKAAIIRRILRYDHETGHGLLDLQKIQHEIELIILLDGLPAIRPDEFLLANEIPVYKAAIISRILRYDRRTIGHQLLDLQKIQDEIELIIKDTEV
jgi:hypothetical protein